MMESYFCVLNNRLTNPERFQMLFGDTHVGQHAQPDSKQGTYIVLFCDFDMKPSGDHRDFENSFIQRINESIETCQNKYDHLLNERVDTHDNTHSSLDLFANTVQRSGYPLYLIIDEYDGFAAEKAPTAETSDIWLYQTVVGAEKCSIVGDILVSAKSIGGSVYMNTFITGTSRSVIGISCESYGYNISMNLSEWDGYDAIVGFVEDDLMRGLRDYDRNMPNTGFHLNFPVSIPRQQSRFLKEDVDLITCINTLSAPNMAKTSVVKFNGQNFHSFGGTTILNYRELS